jgi:hypothetical protein
MAYVTARLEQGHEETHEDLTNELREYFKNRNVVRDFRDFVELHHALAKHPATCVTTSLNPGVSETILHQTYVVEVLEGIDGAWLRDADHYFLIKQVDDDFEYSHSMGIENLRKKYMGITEPRKNLEISVEANQLSREVFLVKLLADMKKGDRRYTVIIARNTNPEQLDDFYEKHGAL